jgi:hypothetical protein
MTRTEVKAWNKIIHDEFRNESLTQSLAYFTSFPQFSQKQNWNEHCRHVHDICYVTHTFFHQNHHHRRPPRELIDMHRNWKIIKREQQKNKDSFVNFKFIGEKRKLLWEQKATSNECIDELVWLPTEETDMILNSILPFISYACHFIFYSMLL